MNNASNNKKVNIKEIFRVFHTLKGNSATLEYKRLNILCNSFCEYFRLKQNETKLNLNDIISLEKCFSALNRFTISIKNGRKGKIVCSKNISPRFLENKAIFKIYKHIEKNRNSKSLK